MKSPICMTHWNWTPSLRLIGSSLTIAALCLTLVANTSAYAQASNDIATAAASSPADWTQFHRDNMQRWNPYETVLGVNNVSGLQLKWKNPIGVYGTNVLPQSTPAVVNGIIYFGSDDQNIYALNASTGAKLWSFAATGVEIDSSPAVANGVVYIGGGDQNLYALNPNTGAKLWSFAGALESHTTPTVVNGVVYIGSLSSNLYALNAVTGAKLWSFLASDSVPNSSPAVVNGVAYFGSDDNNVYAVNASTGAKLWSYTTGTHVLSSPAVANGVVYIGSEDNNVYALNASTGAKLWSYTTGGFIYSSPAVANGVVYIGSTDGGFYALNASTGALLWRYATGGEVWSSPAVANGVVYIDSEDNNGTLYALNASTGAKLWSYTIGRVSSSPTIVDGVVYVRAGNPNTGEGNVYAFSLSSAIRADLFLRIWPSATTVHTGDLLTYAFPVWNLGPNNADFEVLNTQVPTGTVIEYIRISGTPGLGTCTRPPYHQAGQIVCHENSSMAPNTTWTVRLTVKVTASPGTVITANAATMEDTPDPNLTNNTATVSLKVQ